MRRIYFLWPLLLLAVLIGTGCRRDMFSQPKSNPLRANDFFPDAAGSRPIPPDTVSHGEALRDEAFDTGLTGTNFVAAFPFAITPSVLRRGQQRYEIDCVPCHGLTGDGDGMVVKRGLPPPPSFHTERLRTVPVGHFVNVVAAGYGIMLPQAAQVTPEDRWAIAAYIRALQLSQHADSKTLPAGDVAKLEATP